MKYSIRPKNHYRAWKITICQGKSPLDLFSNTNAVTSFVTADDVTDQLARFVADPFMIKRHDIWHIYYEILTMPGRKGVIGLSTSKDLLSWSYQGTVLEESFHLSYPQIIVKNDQIFMMPETLGANAVILYKANKNGTSFSPYRTLISGLWADPTLLYYSGTWWLFTCATPLLNNRLHLFHAKDLTSPWQEHPQSPLFTNSPDRSRPAGNFIRHNNCIYRVAQDCSSSDIRRIRYFEVTTLTTTAYEEHEVKANANLEPKNNSWNAIASHHLDTHKLDNEHWVGCTDGATWQPIIM